MNQGKPASFSQEDNTSMRSQWIGVQEEKERRAFQEIGRRDRDLGQKGEKNLLIIKEVLIESE